MIRTSSLTRTARRTVAGALAAILTGSAAAADPAADRAAGIRREAARIESQVIAWRRDIHQHPELSNREFRTARLVADHLESLGMEVRREIAHTGVVGVLRGGRPGATVALRADMDALPVTEAVDVPFASVERATYLGREVGVMHACGHDAHTAILLGVADVLASLSESLPGTILFVFQPAEERPPPGEKGGAELMLAEGVFDDPAPDAVFALHAVPQQRAGEVAYRAGGVMASSDTLAITVRGRQTHAAYPWDGVDPIAAAARIVTAIESIPARQVDVRIPGVVSIGSIHGGTTIGGNVKQDVKVKNAVNVAIGDSVRACQSIGSIGDNPSC